MNRDITGLQKFVESACIDNKVIKKAEIQELKESVSKCSLKLRESIGDSPSEGWWVPISFFNKKNANGRNYNRKLWENVINHQRDAWAGAPMLADHPSGDSDGSPKDICGIWLDAKLGEADRSGIGLVYGLLVPSGSIGADLRDHLKHGLKVGTSSSGFGKMLSDGVTVDPDTYVIERLSDWVLNPSQGTYFTYDEDDDTVVNESRKVRESVETTNIDIIEEKKVVRDEKNSIIARMEEKKFRKDMEDFLEKASSYKDPQKRLVEFKDIKEYYESYTKDGLSLCADLKEKVEEKIAEEEALIQQAIREKMELQENFGINSPKDLEEKLTKVVEDASNVSKEARDWKEIAEKLQNKLSEAKDDLDARPSETYVEFQKNKIKDLQTLVEERDDKAKKVIKSLYKKIKDLEESKKTLNESINDLKNTRDKLMDELKENHKAYASRDAKVQVLEEELNKCHNTEKSLRESIETLTGEKDNLLETYNKDISALALRNAELMESTVNYKESLDSACEKNSLLIEALNKQSEAIKIDEANHNELVALSEKQKSTIQQLASEARDAQFRLFAETTNKQAVKKSKNLTEPEVYFESLYNTYGNKIVPFKKKITECRTLAEAKQTFFRDVLQELPESKKIEKTRLPESLNMTPEERAAKISKKSFAKGSMYSRLPEGWV